MRANTHMPLTLIVGKEKLKELGANLITTPVENWEAHCCTCLGLVLLKWFMGCCIYRVCWVS